MGTTIKQQTTISGETMKEIKNLIKGHKKPSMPILNNVKIEPTEKEYQIKVTYTNCDLYAEKTFEVIESTIKTAFLLPIDFIKSIKGIKKGDSLKFEIGDKNEKISVTNNGINQIIYCDKVEEYPNNFTKVEYQSVGNLFHKDLEKLKSAVISTSKSESRPVLQYAVIRDGNILSTDAHRLFKSETSLNYNEKDITLYKDFIVYLSANEKKDFAGHLLISDNLVKINTHNASYIHTVSSSNFPDVSRLIPDNEKLKFEILEYEKFKSAINSINNSSNDTNSVVTLKTTGDHIVLSNLDDTIKTEIKVSYITFESLEMSFNSTYLLDSLKQLKSENIQFNISSSVRPFVLNSSDDKETLSLILPVRRT